MQYATVRALLVGLAAACVSMSLGCEKRKPPSASSTVISAGTLDGGREEPGFEGEVDVVVERPLSPPAAVHFVVKGHRARSDVLGVSHAVYDLSRRRARFFDDAKRTYFDGPLSDELVGTPGLVLVGREETHGGLACDVWSAPTSFEICLPKYVAAPRAFSCSAALPLLDSGDLVPACRSEIGGAGESKFSVTRAVRRIVPDEFFATPRGYREKSRVRREVVE